MMTQFQLKEKITKTLDTLPEASLHEIASFLDYLQYKLNHTALEKTKYMPVALGGLWAGITIMDEDIDEVRHEMWGGLEGRDL